MERGSAHLGGCLLYKSERMVRIGEKTCVMRLLSARETLALRREIAQLDCADEEDVYKRQVLALDDAGVGAVAELLGSLTKGESHVEVGNGGELDGLSLIHI